ncbi:acyltransferase family protein [Mangrovimonas spongiae]|uniref:Acyltransferase n=1 Tax=Mangrovimonas spongiae TaxID=2494697 RepID=A0A3R9PKR2_9FLAO|nr:acyltransferase [Mangrovimonas spongiae]RSK40513.1 acyltransferase [Mangrovimonas spongiae]
MKKIFSLKINESRIYGLDVLRAFAIIFVVLVHSDTILPEWFFSKIYYFILDGVSIFFVLSGFLIGGILIKAFEKKPLHRQMLFVFWIRRWFRTLPNYFLILTVLLFLKTWYNDSFNPYDYLNYYIFSQNLFYSHPSFFPEAWSLSVEEWFYLLTPILIFYFLKLSKLKVKQVVVIVIILLIIISTLIRYLKFSELTITNFKEFDFLIRKQVVTRLDSLMYGVFGAYLYYYYRAFWYKYKIVLFGLGMSIFIFLKIGVFSVGGYSVFYSVFSLTIVSIATLFLLPFLSSIKNGKGIIFKCLTFVSLISYSMYLVHLSIVQGWILGRLNLSYLGLSWKVYLLLKYFLYWFFTISISFILYKYFEIPIMNLRDRVKSKQVD